MIFHAALATALVGSLVLALVLWRWAERAAGMRQLTIFLLGVAVWVAGNELPTWFGPGTERLGLTLLATATVNGAVFFHFAVAFTRVSARRRVIAAYVLGAAAMLLTCVFSPGQYRAFAGLDYVATPNAVGWCASLVWGGLAASGQIVLMRAFFTWRGLARRQLAAVTVSSGWGLLCMSGYAIVALDLPMPPWPLLGLPLYPVLLVYGILRYQLLLANAWARRALGWGILVGLAGLMVAALPLLPFGDALGSRFAIAAEVGLAFLILGGPVRRLAERIVYPGGTVTAEDLAAWRTHLAQATDSTDLAARAAFLLSRRLAATVAVTIGTDAPPGPAPLLACRREGAAWRSTLASGWDAAPPGPRRVAEMLGAVLADEALRLDRASTLAQQERDRQVQARLAELGALAATVAHDIRNPLNIIGMAAAMTDADTKAEIRTQIGRIAHLADDLLDYAKPWSVTPVPFDLTPLLREATAHHPMIELRLPEHLHVTADPDRIRQAIGNLIDNACLVATRVQLQVECRDNHIHLHVCDDGPGVPEDISDRVFQPFVSRSPGGTGLGLAIVGRIATVSGGSVALTQSPGWSTCFTLTLPQAGEAS